MKKFSFEKYTGAGNDFILFDKKNEPDLKLEPNIIKSLCDRKFGIGADGILVIDDDENYDFVMEYFNADGSTGSLCGNGARCALKYAGITGRLKNGLAEFYCAGEKYSGSILDEERVKFNLNTPLNTKLNFNIKAYDQNINCSYVDTGSPHVVINIIDIIEENKNTGRGFDDIEKVPVIAIGREIRYADEFPYGTNVNFIHLGEKGVAIRTYERGVENETLACGTGAAASAIVCCFNYNLNPPVNLLTRGGDILIVDFNLDENSITNLSLTGPAKRVFSGQITI